MILPRLEQLEDAARIVGSVMRPTPEICWPALSERSGTEVWVKHENHTPVGAFKLRGGLVYMNDLARSNHPPKGVIAATRGNHGQSIAYAARRHGLRATIVVPHGNSVEKNVAMRALGADLIEYGHDFQAALEYARGLADERKMTMAPSYHELLVRGVATYGLEFLRAAPELDTVYVPIGLGSGISGMIGAREALRLKTKIVGVVAANAPAYALSFAAGKPVSTDSAVTIADGVACRERIVEVSEDEIRGAMRYYFTDTHNVAEGAGAAPLAALLRERELMRGRRAGLVLSGGNVDRTVYAQVLASES